MPKYHINMQLGRPLPCSAEPGNCPYGTDEPHFANRENAMQYYEQLMRSQMFYSFEPGKISVTEIPPEMQVDDRTFVVPKGVYVIGDPSYTIAADTAAWQDWMNLVGEDPQGFDRPTISCSYNNYPIVALQPPSRSGVYEDSFGRKLSNYSGVFAAIPVKLLNKMRLDPNELGQQVVSFREPTQIHIDEDGMMHFGDKFQLVIHETTNIEDESDSIADYDEDFDPQEEYVSEYSDTEAYIHNNENY